MRLFEFITPPFASWRRWWANTKTGQVIQVGKGIEHDNHFMENLEDFLPERQIENIMDGDAEPWDHLDDLLNAAYAAGWQAVLYDGTQRALMLRTMNGMGHLGKIVAEIAGEVPVDVLHLDCEDTSYELRDRALERFLKTGKLPRK